MLESCVESHRDRAQTKNLNLVFDPGGLDDETMVLADEEAIRQIVDNLIDNAIKYTPEGGSVSVICHSDRNSATIEVADTGIGIPRSDLPRIFERFYRVDKARSRELGGTGLGLSIVKHLMQSIGGQIDVTSRVGSGSRFTVHLPRCLVPEIREPKRPTAPDNSSRSAGILADRQSVIHEIFTFDRYSVRRYSPRNRQRVAAGRPRA